LFVFVCLLFPSNGEEFESDSICTFGFIHILVVESTILHPKMVFHSGISLLFASVFSALLVSSYLNSYTFE